MDWTGIATAMQRALLGTGVAEPVTLVSKDEEESACVRGIYERPPIDTDGEGGADFRAQAHRVTVREAEAPAWVDRGSVVRVREMELHVVERVADGQGLITLDCRVDS